MMLVIRVVVIGVSCFAGYFVSNIAFTCISLIFNNRWQFAVAELVEGPKGTKARLNDMANIIGIVLGGVLSYKFTM